MKMINKLKVFFIIYIQLSLILPISTLENTTNTLNYDIVIIGSGLTGLTAAREIKLKNPSASVVILEASNTSGGRVRGQLLSISKDEPSKKQMVDIGAIWISPSHNEIIELAKEFNLDLYSQANSCGERTIFVNNNNTQNFRFKRQSDWNQLPGGGSSILELSSPTIFNELLSQNCQDFINSNSLLESTKDSVFRFLQTFYDAPANSISALQLMLTLSSENEDIQTLLNNQGHGKSLIMKNSLQSLVNQMTKDTLINYNQEVSSIFILADNGEVIKNNSLTGSQVFITTSNGQNYVAQEVIVAISPQKTSKISFEPELNDSDSNFLSNYKSYGDAYYFVASFTSPFWRKNNQSGQIIFSDQTASNSLYWMTTFDISEDNNCQTENNIGLLYGIAHFATELDEQNRIQAYTNILKENLGNQTEELIDIKDIQWTKQPYVNGLVGVIPVNGMTNFSQLSANLFKKRIHFASPELSLKSMGTINGGVIIGKEIANAVLQEMTNLPEIKLQDDSSNKTIVNNIIDRNNNSYFITTIIPTTEEVNTDKTTFYYNTTPHYIEETALTKSTTTQSYESTTPNPNAFVYNTSKHYFDETTDNSKTTESYNQQSTNSPIASTYLNDNLNELTTLTMQTTETTLLNKINSTYIDFENFTTPNYLVESTTYNSTTNYSQIGIFNDDDNLDTTMFPYNTTPHYTYDQTTDITSNKINNNQEINVTSVSSIESSTFPYSTSSHYPEDYVLSSSSQSPTTPNRVEFYTTEKSSLNNSLNDKTTKDDFSSDSSITQKYADAIHKVNGTNDINEINSLISQIQMDISNVSKEDSLYLIKQLNELIDMLIDGIQNNQGI